MYYMCVFEKGCFVPAGDFEFEELLDAIELFEISYGFDEYCFSINKFSKSDCLVEV